MPEYAKQTWTSGDVTSPMDATRMNYIESGIEDAWRRPACTVSRITNQSVSNITWTAVSFLVEDLDTDAMWAVSPNPTRATIVSDGIYLAAGSITWAANATGNRGCRIYKNGSPQNPSCLVPNTGAGETPGVSTSHILSLAAGDYVELFGYQSSGGALNAAVASLSVGMLGEV